LLSFIFPWGFHQLFVKLCAFAPGIVGQDFHARGSPGELQVPQHLFTRPNLTWQHFWNFSTNGTDFLYLGLCNHPHFFRAKCVFPVKKQTNRTALVKKFGWLFFVKGNFARLRIYQGDIARIFQELEGILLALWSWSNL